jgi:ribonuclease BN (tRNA processing enzyme)
MRLTVIGCAGSFPGPGNPASCFVVEHDGHRILLDLGNGALGALQEHVDILDDSAIAGIVLSHLHADHCLDMCSLHVARTYRPTGEMPRIPVLAPADANARLARANGMPERPGMSTRFDFLTHRDGAETIIGPFRITSRRMTHPIEAYAVRVEAAGRALVYSGDTGATDALVDIARDCDLALFEASWAEPGPSEPPRPPDLHMSGREAGQHARRAGARQLVITHVVPWADAAQIEREASEAYDGDVVMARPGLVLDV